MKKFFILIDQLLHRLPHSVLHIIRLGGLLLWFVLATVVVYYAWSYGMESGIEGGQDLSLASIRETVEREKNLKNPPPFDLSGRRNVTVPDTGELPVEKHFPTIPYQTKSPEKPELKSEKILPIEPEFRRQSPGVPTYLGERAGKNIYPKQKYVPDRDAGVGGVRDSSKTKMKPKMKSLYPQSNRSTIDILPIKPTVYKKLP